MEVICYEKKIAKVCALSAVFSLFLSVSAFAGQQTRRVEYNNESFSSGYMDDYNVSHSIRGTASAQANVGWDEGYSGWVISANFDRPDVTVDGNSIGVEYKGDTVYSGSIAYQEFELNNSGHFVIPHISCDEYGDTSFWVNSR